MGISGSEKALMYARSGVMRSDASRSDYYNPWIALTVNGTARNKNFDLLSLEIVDNLNEEANTATLEVFGFTPAANQEIIIGIGSISNRLFRGRIVGIPQAREKLNQGRVVYRIACVDWTYDLDALLVTKQYVSQSATAIAQDIIDTFTSGFTRANIQASLATINEMTFTMEPVSSALSRICNSIGGYWYVDYDKDVHLFTAETTQAPSAISTTNTLTRDFRYSSDTRQLKNRVFVEGGGGTTTAAVAVGGTSIPVTECTWYAAGGGTVLCRGGQKITYTGRSASSGAGNLTGVPASGAGSVVVALIIGDEVNVLVQRDDATSQTTYGVREMFIQDRRLSITGANTRGDAELTLWKDAKEQASFVTEDKFVRSGKTIAISMAASWGIDTSLKIQRVRLSMQEGRLWPQRSVEAGSVAPEDAIHILRTLQEREN